MKFPKNRANCYIVKRYEASEVNRKDAVVLGVFEHFSDAENYADACIQELKDKIGYDAFFCKVDLATFYA